jgi:hypothetical protein
MNKRKITSGNKIIAKFLGFNIVTKPLLILPSHKMKFYDFYRYTYVDGFIFDNFKSYHTLQFHKSWDWLMRACYVFDNIFDSDSDSKTIDDLQIYPIEYSQHCDNIDHLVGCYELEPVYNALIEAIKWYNTYTKK